MNVLGVGLFLILIWLGFDFYIGRKRHLARVQHVETPILHGDIEIFTHGKELFRDYFAALQGAERSIDVLFYIVKDDLFSKKFLTILQEKAREGVEVRLLLDRLGSLKLKKSEVADLQRTGVKFAFSEPVTFPFLFYSAQVRNHRKISVIDGKIAYLGGFNIGNEYIDEGPQRLRPWRDYHLKITGESVKFLQTEFSLDWQRAAGNRDGMGPDVTPVLEQGRIRHQLIPTEANQLEGRFIKLIQLAEKEVMIGTPYFIPSRRILDALLAALRRGVRITVVVPYAADHMLVQEASYRYFRKLLREGAVVYQYKNGFYHAKTILIDDKVCDVGTANFDKRSLFLNKEINCLIYDLAFITRLKNIIKKDIHDSKRLTLQTLEKPNLLRAIKEAIAYCISPLL